ncbi:hypothetical protein [Pseudoalteromonas sp. MER144-MNA-CIBAN-0113]|uniref:hypothetical protein n=1 Tax=Pseudoalteromonas sp. MER144-MNA-CIBAN-0113 TaxID=3140429 RepID=UPI00332888DF
MKKLFDKYKTVKKQLAYDHKGYPIENIVSLELISLIYKRENFNIRRSLVYFFAVRKIKIPTQKKALFSIGDYNRKDYYELLKHVMTSYQNESDLVDLSNSKRSLIFSLSNIFSAFKIVFFRKLELNFLSKITLAASIAHNLNNIDFLEKQTPTNIKLFCAFCSNLNEEAVLNYFFKKNNIPTYSLQHGLWFIYDIPPIDAIAYENVVADKLLCWGEYTRDEFIKYGMDERRLVVAGYPKKTAPLILPKKSHKKLRVLVLLARSQFDENNLNLISLLSQSTLNIEFEFKLHPALIVEKYSEQLKFESFNFAPTGTVQELLNLNRYDCSISYNSTAYYDSYINNCICLRYRDADADNAISVLDDSFTSVSEFESKINLVLTAQSDEKVWTEIEKNLTYILGYRINNYESFS